MSIPLPRLLFAALLIHAGIVVAEDHDKPVRIDDGYGDAFVNYRPYITPGEKAPETTTPVAPPPANDEKPKATREAVNVAWLRQHYPELEQKSIDDPTPENVTAYLYVKRVMLDKAQRFSEMVAKVTNEDPFLNENNRIPYASAGAQSIRNANTLAQQSAVRELAAIGGVVVFVDGTCRFCAQQLPIVSALKNTLGLAYLVVSIDGNAPTGYRGKVVTDNGMYKKLGLTLTPSIVFVPHPTGFQGTVDPNQYLIVAQGFYAQDELVKQIAYAGHSTKLLSQATMKDLDVWDRGVTSTEDLRDLRLDPNQPETFKPSLQPLLLKQYQ